MRRIFCLVALGAMAGACSSSPKASSHTGTDGNSQTVEAGADAPPACQPLFHACVNDGECCAPNRCLNVSGTLMCQQEGPGSAGTARDGTVDVSRNQSDAGHTPTDAACYPMFHACTSNDECCAPNHCLNITGTPACQQEGPRSDAGL